MECSEKTAVSGADPTLLDNQGFTALHHAAFDGHLEVVTALLANTDIRFRRDASCFYQAALRQLLVLAFGISEWASRRREGAGRDRRRGAHEHWQGATGLHIATLTQCASGGREDSDRGRQ